MGAIPIVSPQLAYTTVLNSNRAVVVDGRPNEMASRIVNAIGSELHLNGSIIKKNQEIVKKEFNRERNLKRIISKIKTHLVYKDKKNKSFK